MSTDDLVTVATFGNPQEANIAQGALEAEGIRAYVTGAETASTLWYVGTALGGAKLQVAKRDLERAREVLQAIHVAKESPSVAAWQCPNCGADVDAGFEVCWSCGAAFDESGQPLQPAAPHDIAADTTAPSSAALPSEAPEDPVRSADETAVRAWRAAVFGLAFFPLLVYSFFLLLEIAREELSPAATRKFYGALAIVVTMFAAVCTTVWYLESLSRS